MRFLLKRLVNHTMTKKYRKFGYLYTYSLLKRIKTKAFLISNIILCIATILLTNIGTIIKLFGGDFDDANKIFLYDDTGKNASSIFSGIIELDAYKDSFTVEVMTDTFNEDKKDELLNEGIIVVLGLNEKGLVNAIIYSNELSSTNELSLHSILTGVKNQVWLNEHSDLVDDLVDYQSPVEITFHRQEEDVSVVQRAILMGIGFVLLIPFFILVIFLVQYVGVDIIEEKSSRSIEVIISNVSPGEHFASKVLSAITFVVIQGLLVICYGLLGLLVLMLTSGVDTSIGLNAGIAQSVGLDLSIVTSIMNKVPSIVCITLLFAVAGFFMYSIIIAVLSSMATTMEDFQTFQTPLMLILLGGFYLGIFGIQFPGSVFLKVMGFLPVFSPMLAPLLFITGEMGILEVIISLFILVGFEVVLFIFGMPLYRVSILSYSQDPFFKRVKKLIQKSKYSE